MNDVDVIEQLGALEARESFWAYRQFMNPKMKKGWWQKEVAYALQQFYEDMVAGLKPILILEAPPQHGKSKQVVDFLGWLAGKIPNKRQIYTSYSERLGIRANLAMQRALDSRKYRLVFPETYLRDKVVSGGASYLRNNEILEFVGREGFFRNTTVKGPITGEGLDLGIVDDPLKGRQEARSQNARDQVWDWFVDDFLTRFSEEAALLAIATRWHLDDPLGRMQTSLPNVKILSYPALAIKDEPHRKMGEPLFPEHKSLEFLETRRQTMKDSGKMAHWEALYQQRPQIEGGDLIRGECFIRVKHLPKLTHRVIYGDTAQKTKEANDYSVLECWGKGDDNRIYLLDLVRGKWEAPELQARAVSFWNKHKAYDGPLMGSLREMKIEDKASGTGLIQALKNDKRIPIKGIPRSTDKLTRVSDALPYIETGFVCVMEEAPWLSDFIAECEAFSKDDTHDFDDQIDPMCDAISDMLATKPRGFFS